MLVPLDDRPSTLLFTQQVARIGGLALNVPPLPCLGNAATPGDTTALQAWLRRLPPAGKPTPLIIASDMLCYGGLVASRTAGTTAMQAEERLQVLKVLQERGYRVRVLATLPRLALRTSAAQAPYEDLLRRWAANPQGADPQGVPREILDEYLGVRIRNTALVERLVQWTAEGTIEQLVIGQDDASPRGLNAGEQQQVREAIARLGVSDRAWLMSGADELAMDMVSGWLAESLRWTPRVRIEYSEPSAGSRVPELESLPLDQTIDSHLRLAHAVRARDEAEAEAVLYVATPPWRKPRTRGAHRAYAAEYAHRVHELLDEGRAVGVADLQHLNLADPDLANAILEEIQLTQLESYAGWNTSSNSFGTALAQLVAHRAAARQGRGWSLSACLESEKTHQAFLFARLVDDFWYQAVVRAAHRSEANGVPREADPLLNLMGPVGMGIRDDLIPWAQRLFDRHFKGRAIALPGKHQRATLERVRLGVVLPWKRVFEVEVRADIEVRLQPRSPSPH